MTSELSKICPTDRQLVMNLVEAAGVNVSDWGNFKGGQKKAACNPRYCYDWSFVERDKVVVLNLWYDEMQVGNDHIFYSINCREKAQEQRKVPGKGVWTKRALKMDLAIQEAYNCALPIRVIVCEGARRGIDRSDAEASRVDYRLLDPVAWAVTSYDSRTGNCTVTRGAGPEKYVDQFSLEVESGGPVERRQVTGQAFVRCSEVRRRVLLRAGGRCEWCEEQGFVMEGGKIFLETHHVIPLSEGGADSERNVVAICPNHHREAHHGMHRGQIRTAFLHRFGQSRPSC